MCIELYDMQLMQAIIYDYNGQHCVGQHRWSVASTDAEAGCREMVCPICREMLKPSDAQTHLILEYSQLKQLVNT